MLQTALVGWCILVPGRPGPVASAEVVLLANFTLCMLCMVVLGCQAWIKATTGMTKRSISSCCNQRAV